MNSKRYIQLDIAKYIGDEANMEVRDIVYIKASPIIYFNLIDGYVRRDSEQLRVIGCLLGNYSMENNSIKITNSFQVPHSDVNNELELDIEYFKTMIDNLKKVNPNETVIGWYTVGDSFSKFSNIIQDFFNTQINPKSLSKTNSTNKSKIPIFLFLNTEKNKDTFLLPSYYTVVPIKDPSELESISSISYVFMPLKYELSFHNSDLSALSTLYGSKEFNTDYDYKNIKLETESLELTILELKKIINKLIVYSKDVLNGDIDSNNKVGRFLLDVISQVPEMNPADLEDMFKEHIQDVLTVKFLSNMINSHLNIAKDLQNIINL